MKIKIRGSLAGNRSKVRMGTQITQIEQIFADYGNAV